MKATLKILLLEMWNNKLDELINGGDDAKIKVEIELIKKILEEIENV